MFKIHVILRDDVKLIKRCRARIPIFPEIVHVGGLETEAIITDKCAPLR